MVTCDEVEKDFDLSGSHRSDKSVPDPNLTELWAQCGAAEITRYIQHVKMEKIISCTKKKGVACY